MIFSDLRFVEGGMQRSEVLMNDKFGANQITVFKLFQYSVGSRRGFSKCHFHKLSNHAHVCVSR